MMIPRPNWLLKPNRCQEQELYKPHRTVLFSFLVGHLGPKAAQSQIAGMTIAQYQALTKRTNMAATSEVAASLAWVLENRTDHTELVFQSCSPRNQDPHQPVKDQSVDNLSLAATGVKFGALQALKTTLATARKVTGMAANFAMLAMLALGSENTAATDEHGNLRNATTFISQTLDTDDQEAIREHIARLPKYKSAQAPKPMGESFMDFFSHSSTAG